MHYNFREIEKKWQEYWKKNNIYKVDIDLSKPKYYILDMFPYPSGAGLHVGHPLGYIASDIISRYKRLKGYNVLHPMGFDAFGLPAEQYAIQTGQHPAETTEQNIKRYKQQLEALGFDYDWSREIKTCDPKYYKWTQWTFLQMFKHYYNNKTQKAEPIENLIKIFDQEGNINVDASSGKVPKFTASQWKKFSEYEKQNILMQYRIAYLGETIVNWCPELGTVLANDEVSEGLSVRGGHPVFRVKMKQWCLRVTAYAERLLEGLNRLDWPEHIKEMQRNWIGKSQGAIIYFSLYNNQHHKIEVFTTRPDTIFGVTFIVYAPEHDDVIKITHPDYLNKVREYLDYAINKSERERMTETKKITGVFTGSYAIHPITNEKLPIYVSEYVLTGYGTGVIMAVPAHDSRDYAFAKHFNLPIKQVISGGNIEFEAWEAKDGVLINSDFLNGYSPDEANKVIIKYLEDNNLGHEHVTYRIRDAIFSRQRYWGEPFPIYYKDGIPYPLDEEQLPLVLPEIDSYLPTSSGEAPLARAKNWKTHSGYPLDINTMPGFAGSSGYYFRFMDPHNENEYFSKEAINYWKCVDLYIGGAEHATGHLIYARFWNKFLYDIGLTPLDEPFMKLVNQGMILGRSNLVYRNKQNVNQFISAGLISNYQVSPIHVDISLVENDILDIEAFRRWRPEFQDAEFVLENGKYVCGVQIEKMSKSYYNVVNPDDIIEKYGADTFRLYEMFLGPIEQSKPWDTRGIEGVHRFLKRFWKLFFNDKDQFEVIDEEPTLQELKILHKTIKKIEEDIERLSLNTAVSTFMVCVNQLTELRCRKRKILEPLLILISPFAPHFAEELWHLCGHETSIVHESFPQWDAKYVQEQIYNYPVSFNGKVRFTIEIPLDATNEEIEKIVLNTPQFHKWAQNKKPKQIIIVKGRIVNIVI